MRKASSLLVATRDEALVDDLLDELEGVLAEPQSQPEPGDDGEEVEGDETPFAVLESMFLAADRLERDPESTDGIRDLRVALEGADDRRPPYGVDIVLWQRAMTLGDDLAGVVTDGERDDDAAIEIASELRQLLRPYV